MLWCYPPPLSGAGAGRCQRYFTIRLKNTGRINSNYVNQLYKEGERSIKKRLDVKEMIKTGKPCRELEEAR